jgi:hypothetical protein
VQLQLQELLQRPLQLRLKAAAVVRVAVKDNRPSTMTHQSAVALRVWAA